MGSTTLPASSAPRPAARSAANSDPSNSVRPNLPSAAAWTTRLALGSGPAPSPERVGSELSLQRLHDTVSSRIRSMLLTVTCDVGIGQIGARSELSSWPKSATLGVSFTRSIQVA